MEAGSEGAASHWAKNFGNGRMRARENACGSIPVGRVTDLPYV